VDWKLATTVDDLRITVAQTRDETKRAGLSAALERLQTLLDRPPAPALVS
jgi:hypothetical protein